MGRSPFRPCRGPHSDGPSAGTGTAHVELTQGRGTVCWEIDLRGVSPVPHAGHIHDVATISVILTLYGGPANPAPGGPAPGLG